MIRCLQCDVVSTANDMHLCMRAVWPDPTLTWPGVESDNSSRSLLEDIIPDLSDEGEEGLGKGKRVRVL